MPIAMGRDGDLQPEQEPGQELGEVVDDNLPAHDVHGSSPLLLRL